MYRLFEDSYSENYAGLIRPPEFELVKRVYIDQLNDVSNYYKNNRRAIDNTHILVRMLNIGMPNIDSNITSFISAVYTRAPYIAKHFKLTSEIEFGNLFENLFYQGYGIVLYSEEYFVINEAMANWKNLQAVKVHKHPISSLKFLLPYPKRYPTTENGLSVVSINLPMLFVQYKEFLLNEMSKPEGERGGANEFVFRYVISNMIYSHADICIFNRYMNLYYGINNINNEPSKHPIMLIDYSSRIDNILTSLILYMTDRQLSYYTYLKLIPGIHKKDMLDVLTMPDMVKTRQNWWALYLSRLDEICFLLDIGGKVGYARNRDLINKAVIDVQRLFRENIYMNKLPRELVIETIDKLKKIVNI